MLLIKATLGASPIHGIGLFAAEDIPKDTITWRWDSDFDQEVSWDIALQWPEAAQEYLRTYANRNLETQTWVLCGDSTRFMNHSFNPNTKNFSRYGHDCALRDIRKGEELTVDYRDSDPDFDKGIAKYH